MAVTGTQAMRDYFEDGVTGRTVGVADVEGWRSVLVELHEDGAQRERLGAAARLSAETRFSARLMWADIAEACQARGLI